MIQVEQSHLQHTHSKRCHAFSPPRTLCEAHFSLRLLCSQICRFLAWVSHMFREWKTWSLTRQLQFLGSLAPRLDFHRGRAFIQRIVKALKAGDTLKQDYIVVTDREGMYLSNATVHNKSIGHLNVTIKKEGGGFLNSKSAFLEISLLHLCLETKAEDLWRRPNTAMLATVPLHSTSFYLITPCTGLYKTSHGISSPAR